MADIRLKLLAEMENIEAVLGRLPSGKPLCKLSELEIAGVAALLHSFYNGVENVLKQACIEKGVQVADGSTWHRDLLNATAAAGVISTGTKNDLAGYLAFRHFFSHGYAMELDPERLEPLVANVQHVYLALKTDFKAVFRL